MNKSTKKSTPAAARDLNTEVYEAICKVIDSQFRMYNGNLRHDARYKVWSPYDMGRHVRVQMTIENSDIKFTVTVSNNPYEMEDMDICENFAVYANPSVRLGDLNGATLAEYGKMFSLAAEIVEALKVAMRKVRV